MREWSQNPRPRTKEVRAVVITLFLQNLTNRDLTDTAPTLFVYAAYKLHDCDLPALLLTPDDPRIQQLRQAGDELSNVTNPLRD